MSDDDETIIDVNAETGEVLPATRNDMTLLPTADAARAFAAYKELQNQLDETLADSIMTIAGKQFRKKTFWRAVATGYGLSVEITREERVEDADDWGYLVSARATAPNGRFMDGDGSCFASEKSANQATIHNVRAHAMTRAKNRAIADLCGFGEVTAEEMQQESREARPAPQRPRQPAKSNKPAPKSAKGGGGGEGISDGKQRRLWAMAYEAGRENKRGKDEVENAVRATLDRHGYEHTEEIPWRGDTYDTIIAEIQETLAHDDNPFD